MPDPGHPLPAGVLREGVLERRVQVGALPTRGASCGDASLSTAGLPGSARLMRPASAFCFQALVLETTCGRPPPPLGSLG